MFGIAARRMGYRVHAFEPNPDSPAGQISDVEINAPYTDSLGPEAFRPAGGCHFLRVRKHSPVRDQRSCKPAPACVRGAKSCTSARTGSVRRRSWPGTAFLTRLSPWWIPQESLGAALARLGTPSVLKTADFGYDGKGQLKIEGDADPEKAWQEFNAPRGVLEKWIPFEAELSVIVGRGLDGRMIAFPPSENIHKRHILDISIVPARFPPAVCEAAVRIASDITDSLDVVGLLAVEFFLARDGELLVNELAPRPHNSGHYTFDACATSQFEQQLRAVCGLPLGSSALLTPAVMWNLLGHLWERGEPDWRLILSEPRAKLHLYGKAEPRPGRKMGHVTVLAETREALRIIKSFQERPGLIVDSSFYSDC